MSSSRFRRLLVLAVVAGAVVATAVAAVAYASGRVTSATATRLDLAAVKNPIGGRGRVLGLSEVTIPAGVALALHHHPGTEVAYVARGVLTYSVRSGSVTVMKGAADGGAKPVLRIGAGEQGSIHAGEWIVEQPHVVHRGVNRTTKPVVIYLATLFPIGSPAAIADK